MQYNEEQQALIDAGTDEIIIAAAAAGSGKTATLIGRIERLIKNNEVQGKIVAISFTRSAAKDLRKKLSERLDEDEMKRITTGTFHSVLGSLIRKYYDIVGVDKNFTIIDETGTSALIKNTIELNDKLHETFDEYVEKFADIGRKYSYINVTNSVSLLLNNCDPACLVTGDFPDTFVFNHIRKDNALLDKEQFDFIKQVFKESLIQAKKTSTLTYDQILFCAYLLAISGGFKKESETIGYTIIDEFQDTNLIQYEIMKTLMGNKATLIGDVNQSIYEFRGAKPSIMIELSKKHKIYNMSYNYRSYQGILNLGNNVIVNNTEGIHMFKPMKQGATLTKPYIGSVSLQFMDDRIEAQTVTDMIKRLIQKGESPSNIAILSRSRLALPLIKNRLTENNIPINDTTQTADFMKSETVKDIFAFLKIMTNPKDIYAFMHTLDRPKQGIGPKTLEKIRLQAEKFNMNLVEFVLSEKVNTLTPALKAKVIKYQTIYSSLLDNNNHFSLVDAIEFILNNTGYMTWISNLKNYKQLNANLEKLKFLANEFNDEYVTANFDFTLFDLVSDFLLEYSMTDKVENIEGVVISTVHNAKGLEWDNVFIVGCDESVFPSVRGNEDEIESERRLMYVAITRARNFLAMTSAKHRVTAHDKTLNPSRFINESNVNKKII